MPNILHDSPPNNDSEPGLSPRCRKPGIAVTSLLVFACLLVYSLFRTPIPAVNEPHYLCKAKHYWQPEFCQGDLFLDSSNAHLVFYQTFGLLTRFFTLETSAIIGRIIGLFLLATGWVHLAGQFLKNRLSIVVSIVVYLAIAALGTFSGEWIVGGIESKVVAYGLLFHALAFIGQKKGNAAAICLGLATGFHPVVGVWATLAILFASAVTGDNSKQFTYSVPHQPKLCNLCWPTMLFVVSAAPGLLPAIALLGGNSPQNSFTADYLQVYYRLKHHLNPQVFPTRAYAFLGLLLAVWFLGHFWKACDRKPKSFTTRDLYSQLFGQWFRRFVAASLFILMAGLIIGWLPVDHTQRNWAWVLQAKLLKFYPFRLADVMVPVVVSLTLVERISSTSFLSSKPIRAGILTVVFICGVAIFLTRQPPDKNASRMSVSQKADWLDACYWIKENSPTESHFMTPNESWAFKWYAQRAELAAYKDCPQNARSLIEWNRRRLFVQQWASQYYAGGYSNDDVQILKKEFGVTHIIAGRLGPFSMQPIYANNTYRIYEIPDN